MRLLPATVAAVALALGPTTVAVAERPPTSTVGSATGADAPTSRGGTTTSRAGAPRLRVRTVARGLDIPWDVQPIGDGDLLVTQRARQRLTRIDARGRRHAVRLRGERIWSFNEIGLMGLQVDPGFARNRLIYTCSGWHRRHGGHDIRVIRWKLNGQHTAARIDRTLLTGIPVSGVGQHGGCRLLIADDGALLIGTGDATRSRSPQNKRSLAGKTLRLDRRTGKPWPTNPWAGAKGKKRYVFTYGHRNVQGLAERADGSLWSVEHGTDRDDEVNLLRGGRNYGWAPRPGYDQGVPMTDQKLPGKQWVARWRSGYPTIATSGAAFLPSRGWRGFSGTLAVAALAGERLMFLTFDAHGRLVAQRARLRGDYGRLRAVTVDTDGSLLVTTSNGDGRDRILRIRPR